MNRSTMLFFIAFVVVLPVWLVPSGTIGEVYLEAMLAASLLAGLAGFGFFVRERLQDGRDDR